MKSKQLFFENLIAQNALGGIEEGYNFGDKTLYQIFSDLFSGTSFTKVTLEENAGLEFNESDALRTKYNTLVSDSTLSQTIGLLSPKQASVWKTKNIVQVLDEILFPATLPTYVIPKLDLTDTLDPTLEVGTNVTNNLSLVGTKNNAGNFTSLRILKQGTQIASSTPPPGPGATLNYTDSFEVVEGITTWTGKASYDQGARKTNSQGVEDTRPYALRLTTNPQSADSDFTSNSTQIDGIYPIFYGVSDTKLTSTQMRDIIEAGNANKALVKANGTISITFDAQDKFLWFAHAGVYPNKTKWFVTSGNKGNILGASDLFSSPTSILTQSPNLNSGTPYWEVNYSTYISNFATRTRQNESDGNIMQLQN
jgi:hypothetical protein